MKRFVVILLILAVLAGGGFAAYRFFLAPRASASGPGAGAAGEVVQIETKTLVDTVSASGSIEPEAEVDMKFETGGMVEEVLVKQGQTITAGTVLARLDTGDLELQVRSAEIDLAQAQANLDKLYEPELAEKITAAKAKVESAKLALQDLENGPDPDEVTKAEAALSTSQIALKKAQWAYDQVSYRGDIGAMSQANDLQAATLDYESALADYNIAVKQATPSELAAARSTVADAESSLAELLQAPSAAEVAAQQASVDKAQLTLEENQRALSQAVLIAPTGGVVLQVNIEPGERVLDDATDAAVVIANTSSYVVKMDVDEMDIGQIAVGQKATVTLDALSGLTIEGTVTDIAPSPATSGSDTIVTYEVTITLNTNGKDVGLRSGMTANATIATKEYKDAVVVPNKAIQTDRGTGETIKYVEKLGERGEVTRTEVKLGLRSGSVTQVLAGLAEGDRVVIPQTATTATTSN
jgi:HlyD family secretion protein